VPERFAAARRDGLAAWPFLLSRAELAYGSWLRRRRRITDSREPLRSSGGAFDALGVLPWAERARRELRAAGEADRSARGRAGGELSAQQLQIAELAASGLSNREIGQQLYLSPRTVAAHLYRIFPKPGITSRFQMPQALSAVHPVGLTPRELLTTSLTVHEGRAEAEPGPGRQPGPGGATSHTGPPLFAQPVTMIVVFAQPATMITSGMRQMSVGRVCEDAGVSEGGASAVGGRHGPLALNRPVCLI
jgi:DNA-binding CsgD family transcriptional regulator